MNIEIDHDSWRAAPATPTLAGFSGDMPCWGELLARLGAGWSARRALMAQAGNPAQRSGSFSHAITAVIAQTRFASRAVNPIALANRKSDGSMAGTSAGNSASGTRG